ncbi:hypothetical protein DM02DRAFT_672373 [Periconia macrospinosa]|uniref:F-box domain-containing protein n=1 Tax=Periconia macrospinosa TaxID=97972 RepID=A0A2V1DNV0_9PLEO|nr:hypothetical protein DM02DRAFT_672373 [Periconia macrospinosa]
MALSPTAAASFLSLPLEIRLSIYSYLVTSPFSSSNNATTIALQGRSARPAQQRYGLDLAILRTNKQISEEARLVFLSENEFGVRCCCGAEDVGREREEGERGRLDPPLSEKDLVRVRFLRVELLCGCGGAGNGTEYWKGVSEEEKGCGDVGVYGKYLNQVLTTTTSLKSLVLTATSHSPSDDILGQQNNTTQSILSTFTALSRLRIPSFLSVSHPTLKSIPLVFDFDDCYYYCEDITRLCTRSSNNHQNLNNKVGKGENGIFILACCVLFCRSRVRIRKMLGEFESEGGCGMMEVLEGLVGSCGEGAGVVEGSVNQRAAGDAMERGERMRLERRSEGKVDLKPLVRNWLEGLV